MKKKVMALLAMVIVIAIVTATMVPGTVTANAAEQKTLLLQVGNNNAILNGEIIPVRNSTGIPITPKAVNGKILLPTRFISETLGANVKYNGVDEPVVITNGNTTILVKIGDYFLTVKENGQDRKVDLPVPAHTISNSVYLPFREIGEALGYQVSYSASDKGSFVALANERIAPETAAAIGMEKLVPLRPKENPMEVLFWANQIIGNQAVQINYDTNAHPLPEQTILNAPPLQIGGKPYVPANLLEKMGATFTWDASSQTGTFTYQRTEGRDALAVTVGSKKIMKNKVALEIDLAPVMNDGKLYVPMRAISEGLDFNFYWDNTLSTGIISENSLDYDEQTVVLQKLPYVIFHCPKKAASGKTTWDAETVKAKMIYAAERVGMVYDDTIPLQSTWDGPEDTQFLDVSNLYSHVTLEFCAIASAISKKESWGATHNYFNVIVVPTSEIYSWSKSGDLAFVMALEVGWHVNENQLN